MFQVWTVSRSICLAILAVLSVSDVRKKKVSGKVLLIWGFCTAAYQLLYRPLELWSLAGGVLTGALFLVVSKVTGENFGYGDSLAILILGTYVGFRGLLSILAVAFPLLAAVSMVTLCVKGMNRKSALPFFPFLAAGYLTSLLTGYL